MRKKQLPCGHVDPAKIDWDSITWTKLYLSLANTDALTGGHEILNWLGDNGFYHLTSCPACRMAYFSHAEDCPLIPVLKGLSNMISQFDQGELGAQVLDGLSDSEQEAVKKQLTEKRKVQ
jgi:hypothetical protein